MRLYAFFAAIVVSLPIVAKAAPITYTVSDIYSNFSITGTITTDGTIGSFPLAPQTNAPIGLTGFDLFISEGGAPYEISNAIGFVANFGGLSATATGLYLDFTDVTFLIFQTTGSNGTNFICYQGEGFNCSGAAPGIPDIAVNIGSVNGPLTGPYQPLSGVQEIAFVAPAATPEPGSMTLLATGLLGVAGVVRRRFLRWISGLESDPMPRNEGWGFSLRLGMTTARTGNQGRHG